MLLKQLKSRTTELNLSNSSIIIRLFTITCFLLITAFGIMRIPEPFGDDNALFSLGAKMLNEGATLYVDLWDIKQPGIYLFYYLGGKLFGFDSIGIHTTELVYWLVGCLLITFLFKFEFRHKWISPLLPTVLLVFYFAQTRYYETTQLEILINLPLLICAFYIVKAELQTEQQLRNFFLAGLCAGLALIFKFAIGLILIGFLLVSTYRSITKSTINSLFAVIKTLLLNWIAFSVGVLTILSVLFAWAWQHGSLYEMLWTAFVFPLDLLKYSTAAPISRYFDSLLRNITIISAWIPAIFCAYYFRSTTKEKLWNQYLLAWLIFGLITIAIQRSSYWPYHFLLVYAPLALFTVQGIDKLLSHSRFFLKLKSTTKPLLILIIMIPIIGSMAPTNFQRFKNVVKVLVIKNISAHEQYEDYYWKYRSISEAANIIKPYPRVEEIYVIGNPLVYDITDTRQAIPITGWFFQYASPTQIDRIRVDLLKTKPKLIFVQKHFFRFVTSKAPKIMTLLSTEYRELGNSNFGTWFGLKDP